MRRCEILKAEQHRRIRLGRMTLASDHRDGALRGTADRKRGRPDDHLTKPFARIPTTSSSALREASTSEHTACSSTR
jgi:hypothetical protein